jgi:hypothetical protein
MRPDLILGQFDRDLACAIALNFVEDPRVVANLDCITLHDVNMRLVGSERDWLGDDPLEATTRDYLQARRDASLAKVSRPGQPAWGMASGVKARDAANEKARQARDLGRALLAERGTLAAARRAGRKLLGVD